MAKSKVTSVKEGQASPTQDQRNFRRRSVSLRVDINDASGNSATGSSENLSAGGLCLSPTTPLEEGSEGTATVAFASGAKITVPARVVWKRTSGSNTEYGLRFERLDGEDRVALLDAVYAAPGKTESGAPFDTLPNAHAGVAEATSSLSPSHHAYYLRLIHRIEKTHALSLADTDRLLFAVLQQGRDLSNTLIELGLTTYDKLETYLSDVYGVPYVNLNMIKPDVSMLDVVPESIALSQNVVPIQRVDGKYAVAMADPLDLPARDILHLRTKGQVELRFAFLKDVEKAIKAVYQGASIHSADRLIDEATAAGKTIELYKEVQDVADLETLRRLSDATPIVSLVDSILRSAVEERASDIHLEPVDDCIIVRFRLDGILHEMRTIPRNILASVVSRIKIMARLDITERHIPQDGRIAMRYGGKDYELRVACIPTVFGEKVVVRLLEKNPTFKTLRSIGFSDRNYSIFAPLVRRPYGMILFCGPTGSGKSTTLFACIQEIHDGTTNIMTVEDPVEYRVRGINHIELNPRRDLTFPTVLRSILRCDPDVIYVGEIRDRETADVAVRAALTGHLLFSTLHTNSAIQAITRLVDIGIEGHMISASLIGVVGQRLLRNVCGWCRESYAVPSTEAELLHDLLGAEHIPKKLTRGRGCAHCHNTGYYGRSAVHEVIIVDEELRHRISTSGSDASALLDYLKTTDFQDLRAHAVARVLEGQTTVQEVVRVTV